MEYKRLDSFRIEIPRTGDMNTNCIVYINRKLEEGINKDESLDQIRNVACLPGIKGSSLGMPDIHQGYGFPIGGVAAFSTDEGIVSPGGVGYDINCGVRVLATDLHADEIRGRLEELTGHIFANIPCGVGSKRQDLKVSRRQFKNLLENGSQWALNNGFATRQDIECTEDNGKIEPLSDTEPSQKAMERGIVQLGTLGSGNHFIEIGYVDRIYDPEAASILGIGSTGQVTVSVHSGSRGFGHQVCTDSLNKMVRAAQKYNIRMPDRQLSCAPVYSPEGKEYLSLMAQAANFAYVNRQIMTHWIRESFAHIFGISRSGNIRLVYDVCHNIAKIEEHLVDNQKVQVCIHRKGATRAFGPGDSRIPEKYRSTGQPVIIPGDMGRYSFILLGTAEAMKSTFGSTCHGAGRMLSRHQAIKKARGMDIKEVLSKQGIFVVTAGRNTILEEYPEAYKDITDVVDTVAGAGISRKCIRLKPMGVIKG